MSARMHNTLIHSLLLRRTRIEERNPFNTAAPREESQPAAAAESDEGETAVFSEDHAVHDGVGGRKLDDAFGDGI